MQTISELVRNVTIIVLIAGFLEMMLPSSELKRFIKMVMGLFVLVSILNPIVSLLRQETAYEVFAWQDPVQGMKLNSILQQGEELSRDMTEKAEVMYANSMAKQMETIVKLVKGVAWVEADVEVKETGKHPDYGKIERAVLVIGIGEQEQSTIEPINIKISGEEIFEVPQAEKDEIKYRVVEALKNFYGLTEEQISVVIVSQ
ncbi:MAG: stage III sporulation protein AF [Desulfitobacteriaceae bacterium]|nr:stage III sporulation protein AF [Desulfitobacteriaceae bacterium]MDD4752337.1 stage III sporulation protein AF [Desulfitobacteriaceae bacterium]